MILTTLAVFRCLQRPLGNVTSLPQDPSARSSSLFGLCQPLLQSSERNLVLGTELLHYLLKLLSKTGYVGLRFFGNSGGPILTADEGTHSLLELIRVVRIIWVFVVDKRQVSQVKGLGTIDLLGEH